MASIRICTEMPDPIPEHSSSTNAFGMRMAMETNRMWNNGEILTVRLLGGSAYVRKRVEEYAKVWLKYANLRMVFVESGDAQIRVSFNEGDGCWSEVGTNCLKVPQDKPTMNFGWLTERTPETVFRQTVMHEFGHALGCIHEHQSPAMNIPWNKDAVYAYYRRTQDWSKSTVRRNIFTAYSADRINASAFDKESIMLYHIPADLTLGGFSTAPNYTLSRMDQLFISRAYPRSDAPDSDLDESDNSDSDHDSDPLELLQFESIMNGTWGGSYYYDNGTTDGESTFKLSTWRISGRRDAVGVRGSGRDSVGSFAIEGTVRTSGDISFKKTYDGSPLSWPYSGNIDRSRRTMQGIWGGGLGSFSFRRR